MHLNCGALGEAERSLQRAIAANPKRVAPHLALIHVLYRLRRRQDARAHLNAMTLADIDATPLERIELAQALRAVGLGVKAIGLGYDVLQLARNDPTVAMRYVGLVLVPDDGSVPEVDAVAPDTWFSMTDGAGTTRSYLIEGEVDRPADGALSPSHPTALAATGRRPEETFSLPNSSRTWRIVEVQHKFLHAAREVMESFEEDFPNATGFRTISLPDGDLQPALDEVRKHSEALRERADLYIKEDFPLCVVAAQMGRDTIGLADYVRWMGHSIKACVGTLPEREAALRLIIERRASGAVLDAYTAWTAATMDALDVLTSVFGSIELPRSALDELLKVQDRMSSLGEDGSFMTMAWRNGQFYRELLSAEDVRSRQAYVESEIANIEAACSVVPSVAPDHPTEIARTLTSVFDDAVLDAANLAAQGRVLVSEDLSYRTIAEAAAGAQGVWLHAVFMLAHAEGIIDEDRYDNLVGDLAERRHSHVALGPRALVRAMRQDSREGTSQFDALAEFIGSPKAHMPTHLSVVTSFLARVWPDAKFWPESGHGSIAVMRSSGKLLENLLRSEPQEWCAKLAAVRFMSDEPLRRYIDAWITGHFYSLEEVVAVQKLMRPRLEAQWEALMSHLAGSTNPSKAEKAGRPPR